MGEWGRRGLFVAAAGLAVAAYPGVAGAQPNPYLDSKRRCEIILDDHGGWRSTTVLEVTLARTYELDLTIVSPDVFRLPDEPGQVFAPLLQPELGRPAASWDGAPVEPTVERVGHHVGVGVSRDKQPEGSHRLEVVVPWSGSSRIVGDQLETWFWAGSEKVEVIGEIDELLEVGPYARMTPVGERTARGWSHQVKSASSAVKAAGALVARRRARPIPEPRIIRG